MSNNFTIVVEGAGGVGKSALTAKYCNNTFLEHVRYFFFKSSRY